MQESGDTGGPPLDAVDEKEWECRDIDGGDALASAVRCVETLAKSMRCWGRKGYDVFAEPAQMVKTQMVKTDGAFREGTHGRWSQPPTPQSR